MKLVHPNFLLPIEFEEDRVINIIIESPKIFRDYIGELYQQTKGLHGKWVLSEKGELINIEKFCDVIIDPYTLDINNRKILGKLYEDIKNSAMSSELLLKWNQLYTTLSGFVDELTDDFNFHLDYANEIDMKEFLKFMNLHFTKENISLIEKILDYMHLYNSIIKTRLFVFINVKSFFNKDELKFMYEQAFYQKFFILLLENHDSGMNSICEKKYIIDKDSCLIC